MTAIVRSKLTPPVVQPDSVVREALMARLLAAPGGSLTSVIAPAGWGKSTVLAQRMAAATCPVAYVGLDRFDNDASRCWLHVLSAVHEAIGTDVSSLTRLLREPLLPLVTELADPLVHAIDDSPLLVVFDDMHVLHNPELLESIRAFIDGSQPSTAVVISSRSEPPLGLDRRRIAGTLMDVTLADLKMELGDAEKVLERAAGRPVETEHVERLLDRTEGWAAALQVAGLCLRATVDDDDVVERFTGNDRQLGSYLATEVFAQLAQEDQEFLLGTAVLEELDVGLCDAVRDASDSARRLVEVAQGNTFVIPMSRDEGEYRFHQLFQQWLLGQASRANPAAVTEAHRRAARAFADRKEPIPAMDHAHNAQDWPLAYDLFTRFTLDLVSDGNHSTIARWCRSFPADVDTEILVAVKLAEAWEGVVEGDVDAAERLCRTIEQLAPNASAVNLWQGDPGQLALIRAFCQQLRGELTLAADQIALARLHGVTPVLELALRMVAAITDYWTGVPDEGAFMECAIRAEERGDLDAMLIAQSYVAHIHLDVQNHAKAEAWLERIFATANEHHVAAFWFGPLARAARARVLLGSADYAGAVGESEAAISVGERRNDVLTSSMAHLVLAEALHGLNERSEARTHTLFVDDMLEPIGNSGIMADRLRVTERQLRLPPRKPLLRFPDRPIEDLSDREMALLRLLPGDLNQRELGDALFVSFNTIKSYNRSIYRKLGVSSRDDAVAAARAMGLL